jgi:hypothetical protein
LLETKKFLRIQVKNQINLHQLKKTKTNAKSGKNIQKKLLINSLIQRIKTKYKNKKIIITRRPISSKKIISLNIKTFSGMIQTNMVQSTMSK